MNISRVLSTAARQASIRSAASRSVVNKLSPQRGFAVAASQQLQNNYQGAENANNSSRVHGLLAAAAAAAGMTAMANQKNDRTAECCGIAGVVGATGDARYVVLVQWNRHGDSLLGSGLSLFRCDMYCHSFPNLFSPTLICF